MIVVGLMSGISATGIDVAVCEITGAPPRLRCEVVSALSIPWPHDLRKMVRAAWQPEQLNTADFCLMDVAVGEAFAAAALEGIANAGYYPEQIDLIGMQGQPVHHHIRDDGRVIGLVQLGQPSVVAAWTGITTVGDFRQRDIAAGGLGAPLNGYVEWLLLRHKTRFRAVQNFSELTSVTFLPPLSVTGVDPLCFDIGPGLRMLDEVRRRVQAVGADPGATGQVNRELLQALLKHSYLIRKPPKIAPLEFTADLAGLLWEEAMQDGLTAADIVETFLAYITAATSEAYRRYAPESIEEIVVSGPGRADERLLAHFREAMAPARLLSLEDVGLDGESKDAMVIAVLAYEAWHNRPGTLPALTGVRQPVPLGCIMPGSNYEKLLKQTWNDRH